MLRIGGEFFLRYIFRNFVKYIYIYYYINIRFSITENDNISVNC